MKADDTLNKTEKIVNKPTNKLPKKQPPKKGKNDLKIAVPKSKNEKIGIRTKKGKPHIKQEVEEETEIQAEKLDLIQGEEWIEETNTEKTEPTKATEFIEKKPTYKELEDDIKSKKKTINDKLMENEEIENEKKLETEVKATATATATEETNKSDDKKKTGPYLKEQKEKMQFAITENTKKNRGSTPIKGVSKKNEQTKTLTNEKSSYKINDILRNSHKMSFKKMMNNKDFFFKKAMSKTNTDYKTITNHFLINSQEKDVFEYVPDNSNYNICHNEPNELYKDVMNMNKHFINELNSNIYTSPLNTYLSNIFETSPNVAYAKSKKFFGDDESQMKNKRETNNNEKVERTIDETATEPKISYEFFKNKVFKHYENGVNIEIDPSILKYNDSTEYEYNQNLITFKTDPLSYLNKLKCEIEDITQYIKNLAQVEEITDAKDKKNPNEMAPNEKIIKQILHNRDIPELLLELTSMEKDINTILSDDKIKKMLKNEKKEKLEEKHIIVEETELHNLFQAINQLKERKTETFNRSKSGTNLMNNFDIYALKNDKEKKIQVNDLLILEKKIADLEKILGIEKMPLLPYDDLNQAIIDLYNKLNLLDPNKLENVKKKVQSLQSEFFNLKKTRKEILNISKERGNYEESIDELFKILEVWKKTHHILPSMLTRLHQLKTVHDNVQSFSSRLNDLEEQQNKLDDTLNSVETNINTLNGKIDENVTFLQETLKKIENAVTSDSKA